MNKSAQITSSASNRKRTSQYVAFGLFRLFDIWKPWPIGYADRQLQGGFGIMMDDILAGIIAAVVLYGAFILGMGYLHT